MASTMAVYQGMRRCLSALAAEAQLPVSSLTLYITSCSRSIKYASCDSSCCFVFAVFVTSTSFILVRWSALCKVALTVGRVSLRSENNWAAYRPKLPKLCAKWHINALNHFFVSCARSSTWNVSRMICKCTLCPHYVVRQRLECIRCWMQHQGLIRMLSRQNLCGIMFPCL